MLQPINSYLLSSLWVTVSIDLAAPCFSTPLWKCSSCAHVEGLLPGSTTLSVGPHPRQGDASLESVLLTWSEGSQNEGSFWTNHQTDVLIFPSLFFHCPPLWILLSPFPMILTEHVICDWCIFHGCYYAPSLSHLPLARCQTSLTPLTLPSSSHPKKKKKSCSVPVKVTVRPIKKERKKDRKKRPCFSEWVPLCDSHYCPGLQELTLPTENLFRSFSSSPNSFFFTSLLLLLCTHKLQAARRSKQYQ